MQREILTGKAQFRHQDSASGGVPSSGQGETDSQPDPFFERRQDFIARVSALRLEPKQLLVVNELLKHVDKTEAVTIDQLASDVYPDRPFSRAKPLISNHMSRLRFSLPNVGLNIAYELTGRKNKRGPKQKGYYLAETLRHARDEEEISRPSGADHDDVYLVEGLLSILSELKTSKKEDEVRGEFDELGRRIFRRERTGSDKPQYVPGTGIRLGGNIGLNEDGHLAWVGPKPDPKTLPPNPVTHVTKFEPAGTDSSHNGLPEIKDFTYKNGEEHAHRVRYEEAEGATSEGICIHCGAHKTGKNWLSDTDFITNEEHRVGLW